jgi:putative transposase
MHYRRAWMPGGCFFFTVVTASRRPHFRDAARVAMLRRAIREVRATHPFDIDAMVVLPDHLHCIWTLPDGDTDFAVRWRLIKAKTSRLVRMRFGDGKLWQRRYWEHRIRDEGDFRYHVDYIHYNPVHHGWARQPVDWPWSSIHTFLHHGRLEPDWGRDGVFIPCCVENE